MFDNPLCPMCDGIGAFLGTLGCLDHFRCIQCGAQFSTDARASEDIPDLWEATDYES